jgi:integrase/recombinase XerD
MPIQDFVHEFLSDVKFRGLSPRTHDFYKDTLRRFQAFTTKNGILEPQDIQSNHLKTFSIELQEQMSIGGVNAYLRGVRAFCGFLIREELLQKNPFTKFKLLKQPQLNMPHVKFEEYETLMIQARLGKNPLRDQAIIGLLFDTGLRASELTGLQVSNLFKDKGMLKVLGKGNKERVIPVSRVTVRRIQSYISNEREKTYLTEIFLADNETPLNYNSLRLMTQRLFSRANLEHKSLHCWRRGFSCQYIKNSGDVFSLSRILGHTTLHMSNKYAVLDSEDLKEIHIRASPIRKA